jgi:hypothetical protein
VCTSFLLRGINQLQQHLVGGIFRRTGCHLAVCFTCFLSRETLSLRPRQLTRKFRVSPFLDVLGPLFLS